MLVFQNGPTPGATIELRPGVTRIGRDQDNEVQIDDDSISGYHCELIFEADELVVQDLRSTNGTFVDGQPVREAPVRPGQRLTLGTVELLRQPVPDLDPAEHSSLPSLPAGTSPCRYHPQHPAQFLCRRCHHLLCASCSTPKNIGGRVLPTCPKCRGSCVSLGLTPDPAVAGQPPSFFQALPGIFSYPLKANGPAILLGGSAFFALLGSFQGAVGWIGLYLGALVWGYLFAYLDNVITTTANGSDAPPSWPDFSDWWSDVVSPLLRWLAVLLVCLGPASYFLRQVSIQEWANGQMPERDALLGLGLGLAGILYLPMALLAAAMADSLTAINPLVVIPSILKLPLQYAATCLLLLAAVALQWFTQKALAYLPFPILTGLVAWGLFLYTLMLEMRLLGLLYQTHRDRLRWFRR